MGVSPAASDSDTIFINDYRPERRFQRLLARARPLAASDLPPGPIEAAAVSLLYVDALEPDFVPALRKRGTFVALDAQGLLRRVGQAGLVETFGPPDLADRLSGLQAVKFSVREFHAVSRVGGWTRAAEFAVDAGVELLITHGAGGAQLFTAGRVSIDARTSPPDVADASTLDTTGAGDVLLAAYAHARGGGATPTDALAQATESAADLIAKRQQAASDRRALLEPLCRLHACATWASRRVPQDMAGAPPPSPGRSHRTSR